MNASLRLGFIVRFGHSGFIGSWPESKKVTVVNRIDCARVCATTEEAEKLADYYAYEVWCGFGGRREACRVVRLAEASE